MCGLLLSADMESCCPSAWGGLSAYMEYEVSAVKYQSGLQLGRAIRLVVSLVGDKHPRVKAGVIGWSSERRAN